MLESIRKDPAREILERSCESAGLTFVAHEVSNKMLHFELKNESHRSIYLPQVTGPATMQVLIERRVIESNVGARGVVIFGEKPKRAELSVSAANLQPFKCRLELP